MKMQVHDNFGRSLLSIRRILERKEDPDKMDKQLSALRHLVYILTDSSVENMEELCADTIRHAEELGISVQISGNFPMHPSYRLLIDRAIRECVTNCARHAHGSTVWVKIDKMQMNILFRLPMMERCLTKMRKKAVVYLH